MKTKLFTLILALVASVGTIFAAVDYNVSISGILYNLYDYYGHRTAYVTYSSAYSGNVVIPSMVTYAGQTYTVTSIDNYAFRGCTGLTSVAIPNSVTSIGAKAFYGCTGLTSVTIPNSVTSIGDDAFEECTGLASPVYNVHVFAYMPRSFSGAYTIPDGVTYIGRGAFNVCTGLTSIEIPNSVTYIGYYAFSGCTDLTSFEIPNSVTSIGYYAFSGCTGLTSIDIPNSVTAIEEGTFSGCTGLTSVTIPNSVTYIGSRAFNVCTGLTSVTIPNSVTSIGYQAFISCAGLTSVTIPSSVTYIGINAFYGCSSLTSVAIEAQNPPTLDSYVFNSCPALHSIYVPCGSMDAYKYADNWLDYASKIKYHTYTINTNAQNGSVAMEPNEVIACSDITLTATPNEGYYFTQWSDGITDNPRTIILTQDTTLTAEFAKNNYTITDKSDIIRGYIEGAGTYEYLDNVTLTAIPNYGYHFDSWTMGTMDLDGSYVPYKIAKFQIPSSWKNPYAWVWKYGRDGNWKSLKKENGWYVYYGESDDYGIIIVSNGANWTHGQTNDIILEDYACYSINYYNAAVTRIPNSNNITITLTSDTVLTAKFAKNSYTIHDQSISSKGYIEGVGVHEYLDTVALTAISKNGYHFTQWSDGVTDNSRTIVLTQDTSFIAEFAPDQFSINVSCDEIYGYIDGENGVFDYLTEHTYEAIANYGYHFAQWSDGNTDNPRTIVLNGEITLSAIFAKNSYTIADNSNHEQGYIDGIGSYEYLDERTITAIGQYGYHFAQWSDGNKDNPRTIILTQDTTFTAEFAIDKSGTCGENDALIWTYDDQSKTLTITGNGALTDNYTFGLEAPSQMNTLIIGDGITAIGDSAFYGMTTINHLFIGANVASIGDYAFAECRNFDDITCYATIVPAINATTFENVGNKQYIYLYVPEDRERAYKRDEFWGEFDIQIKCAEITTSDGEVTIVPTDNTAEISWPIVSDADTYEIEITKDGEVICVLKFNSNGQLAGIAFAPGRNGANHTQQAQTEGFKFTVTGLTSGTKYGYTIDSKDAGGLTIDSKSGSFTTTVEGEPVNPTEGINDILTPEKATKVLRDNQILILRGDKTYTLTGAEVK